MTDQINSRDAVTKRLSELQINFASSPNGLLTVYTTSEPLFCFDGYDDVELHGLVSRTLKCYASNFYDVHDFDVGTVLEALPEPALPVERVEVHSRLRPIFDLAA